MTTRRKFLRGLSASALSAATLGGTLGALSSFQTAQAADVSGYKAVVCLFLFGGMDNWDTVIPYDQPSYDRYADIRSSLISQYAGQPGGHSRGRDALLALNPLNGASFGGRQFALPPQMAGLHNMFETGQAAIVGNVGPLIEPVTRSGFESEQVRLPKRLFSHNDQQSTWMASAPEGAQFGWGGRFVDAAINSGANGVEAFSAISSFSSDLFLSGQRAAPYQVDIYNRPGIDILEFIDGTPFKDPLNEHFRSLVGSEDNLFKRDYAAAAAASFDLNERYNSALNELIPSGAVFPETQLGAQLKAVSDAIAIRGTLGMQRQIFFVGMGGYDTHSSQAQDLPRLQTDLDQSIVAFYQALSAMNVSNDVTLFTASDFGRTLAINGDGTDHGWGGHHFVVGGAVQGQTIFGGLPEADFDHNYDAGAGRLIPQVSVEQFAEPIGRWFGLTDAELNTALPSLSNFTAAQRAEIGKLIL